MMVNFNVIALLGCLAVASAQEYDDRYRSREVVYETPQPSYVQRVRTYEEPQYTTRRIVYRTQDRYEAPAYPTRTVYRTRSRKTYAPRRTTYVTRGYAPEPAPRQSYQPVQTYQSRPVQTYQSRPVQQTYSSGYTPRTTYAPKQTGYAPKYEDNYDEPAQYTFSWQAQAVGGGYDDGYSKSTYGEKSDFGHEETRNGDNTEGKYWVELPDGRLQTVEYYVDGYSGYVAKVSYSGGEYAQGYGARQEY